MAFNNAGFDLTGDFRSLAAFSGDWIVLPTIGVLIVLGGLGFAIIGDVAGKRRWTLFALETKVVLFGSAVLLVGGSILLGALEWNNPETLGAMPVADRALNAVFESVTVRSGGFTVVDTGRLTETALFIAMALMFIGTASGSTGGGIKVSTLGVLLIAILSTVRGRPSAEAFGRRIPHQVVYRALSVALLSVVIVFVFCIILQITGPALFVPALFEVISAAGTVGLSTGITPDLSAAGHLLLAVAMFAGRLGPLTLVLALAARDRPVPLRPAVESVRIG
jgi:trk system potassium uptake protein TrkH